LAARDWETVPLGDVATLGIERVAIQLDDEYRLAGVLIAGQGLFWREAICGRETNYPALHRLREGQLVMRKLTAWEGPITTVPPEFDGAYVSSEFPTFTLDKARVLPQYMRLICQRPSFHAEMRLRSTGTAERRNRLKPDDLLSIEVTLPPIDEQGEIVSVLAAAEDAAAASVAERDAAFVVLDAAVEALLAPTGDWDDLPAGWQLGELGELADVRTGIAKGRKTDKPVRPTPFLRAANVQNGFLDLREIKTIDVTDEERARFALETGDVLMVEGSGSPDRLGRGWIWDGPVNGAIHQNHVFRARADRARILPRFLAYAIAARPAREHFRSSAKTTSGLATINSTQTRELPIPIPQLDEQERIVGALDVIRATAVALDWGSRQAAELRTALLESLLSGEQRLRATVAA
jgi:type I restriction enzyme, S subunit